MKVVKFIELSTNKDINPIKLGFGGYSCGKSSLFSKVLPKVRKVLKSYDPEANLKINHRRLMKPGVRGIKCNFHVVEGWVGDIPLSIVLDENYKEV